MFIKRHPSSKITATSPEFPVRDKGKDENASGRSETYLRYLPGAGIIFLDHSTGFVEASCSVVKSLCLDSKFLTSPQDYATFCSYTHTTALQNGHTT